MHAAQPARISAEMAAAPAAKAAKAVVKTVVFVVVITAFVIMNWGKPAETVKSTVETASAILV